MSLSLKSLRTRFKEHRTNSNKRSIKNYNKIQNKKILRFKSKILSEFIWTKLMIKIKTGVLIRSILIRLSSRKSINKSVR